MKRNQKVFGFTLVEIMIVVTIIGILASLAVPAFQRARWKALETSVRNNLRQIWGAAQQYMLENGVNTVKIEKIIQWRDKEGKLYPEDGEDGKTSNPGYTTIIQQVAQEKYNAICVYTESFEDTKGEKVTAGNSPKSSESELCDTAIGLQIKDETTGNFIKLRL